MVLLLMEGVESLLKISYCAPVDVAYARVYLIYLVCSPHECVPWNLQREIREGIICFSGFSTFFV